MRAILDTNVLLSAAIYPASVPRRVLDVVRAKGELVFTSATFAEIQEILFRGEFDRYIDPADRVEFVATVFQCATWIEPTEQIRLCRDPKDDKILEAAAAGNVEFVVTGDEDLLTLSPFRGIRIVSPAAFLRLHQVPPR